MSSSTDADVVEAQTVHEAQTSRSYAKPQDHIPLITQVHGESAHDNSISTARQEFGSDQDSHFTVHHANARHQQSRSLSPDSLLQKEENVNPPPRNRETWLWEVLNTIFSISCVIAIIVILSRINGQTLLSWTAPISPNAMISILSTALKASMILAVAESISQLKWLHYDKSRSVKDLQVFDDASRGPWGSFSLLWRARRVSPLTYVGCAVTIAAIALDPFAQQILSYAQQPYVVPGPYSSVNRSLDYDKRNLGLTHVYMNMFSLSTLRLFPLSHGDTNDIF